MKILVGSTNKVKISAVKRAFGKYFDNVEVKGMAVQSSVTDQPIGDETFKGAKNRCLALQKLAKADFYVGVEGGISKIAGMWLGYGCMCVMDKKGRMAFGTSPMFPLPDKVIKRLLKGEELGLVMDDITGVNDTKHKSGAIGFFTNNVMDRRDLYVYGLIVAIAPFVRKGLFFPDLKQIK